MPEGIVTPTTPGTPVVTPPAEGTSPNDQGSLSAGLDTPLDSAVLGGKYNTVGDLVNAAKNNQQAAQGIKPPEPEPDDDDKPLTKKDLRVYHSQSTETVKFNKIASKLGITVAQKKALNLYGSEENNVGKAWQDLAVELGFSDADRVSKALGQTSDERGGNLPGSAPTSIKDAKTASELNQAVDNLSDDELNSQIDEMAGKTGDKGHDYK